MPQSRFTGAKNKLLEMRREALAKSSRVNIGGAVRDVDDDESVAQMEAIDDVTMAVASVRSDTLNRINEALATIENGTYGTCRCGQEISSARLTALPFATACIDCATAKETGRRRHVGPPLSEPSFATS